MNRFILLISISMIIGVVACKQSSYIIDIETDAIGAEINPDMYGIFFEDINFGADGGLYAELVKNRSFEFPQSLMGWNTFGNVQVRNDNPPFERNPHYVRLSYSGHRDKSTGLDNEGFFGMGFEKDAEYRFSVWAKCQNTQTIRIELIDQNNDIITSQNLEIEGNEWKKYQTILKSSSQTAKGKLRIFLTSAGPLDLEHISLFPTDTWQQRENGMRKDLAQALADLNPGVFRFPGGCIVEGTQLETRYDWKKSVGQVENRPLNENRWNHTFAYRLYPDYFQSYGLGFFEFFQLCEDFGAEPLPVLSVGLACQFQNDSPDAHAPLSQIGAFVQDALDLIEFANGTIDSEWGKVRNDMGHPEPFGLKYLAIGNEQWGTEYIERLEPFVKAIREKHPDIMIIGSSGPYSEGEDFDYLWPEMTRLKADLVDEHYYMEPEWFLNNATRYDSYNRNNPKVFAGEYAAHVKPNKPNSWEAAIAEASFMTGLERNADIVRLATYAPLFAHIDGWQWSPDMIWFDNLRVLKTPNYYVQQLYGQNSGTNVLSTKMNGNIVAGQDSIYATACIDVNSSEIIVKLTNVSQSAQKITLNLLGLYSGEHIGTNTSIAATKSAINSFDNPQNVAPQTKEISFKNQKLNFTADANSFNVIRFR